MTLLMTSRAALPADPGRCATLVAHLVRLHERGHQIVFLSNHAERDWFDDHFAGTNVTFIRFPGRQRAAAMSLVVEKVGVPAHEILVLAGSRDDVQMAKNGGLVLLGAGWTTDAAVRGLGLQVADAAALTTTVDLLSQWRSARWYYAATAPGYALRALSNISSLYVPDSQAEFGRRITSTVKAGGPVLAALLAITTRSMETGGLGSALERALYGTFPSSASTNDDTEVLSDFTHRLRTTVSRVRFAKRGEPLFVRHTPSAKRSWTKGANREDPTEQLLTLHVNPWYRGKLDGRHVVVVDDCLTYGVSSGVAAALLRHAGADAVTCVALGKFGNQTRGYDIAIRADPFAPLSPKDIDRLEPVRLTGGANDAGVQQSLIELLNP